MIGPHGGRPDEVRIEGASTFGDEADEGSAVVATAGDAAPAAPPTSLRANFAWTLAGNVVYAGCQWGILVVLAKLTSPEQVGQFALGYALTAPVFLLAGLQLRSSQATDSARGFPFSDYLSARIAGMVAAVAATGVLACLPGYDGQTRLVVLAIGASKAIEGVSDVYYGAMQQHERMRPIAVSLVARGVLALAVVAGLIRAGGGLLLAVAAMGASWVVVLVLHDVPAARPFVRAAAPRSPAERWRSFRALVVTCLPLGLCLMLISLRTNIPRYFVQEQLGPAELGVFAALSSLLVAGNLVLSALGQSATPRMGRYFERDDVRAFRLLVARLAAIATLVGIAGLAVAVAAGRPVLRVVFGPTYAGRTDVLAWLMAAGLVTYVTSVMGYALTATRRFAIQLPLFTGTTLLCAAGCAWLVPAHGLVGAAVALGGSFLVELVAIWFLLEHALRTRRERSAS